VTLFGSETFILTLREEHKLRVFVNRVQRRISGPKRDEVMGGGCIDFQSMELNVNRIIKSIRIGMKVQVNIFMLVSFTACDYKYCNG
jgi:hypothetical protein